MSMRKKILFINILVTIAIALTGCWNAMELNALGITLVLGLDFENDKVIVTAEIIEPVPAKEKSVLGKGSAVTYVQGIGDNIFDAFRDITLKFDRRLYISHNKIIIFGEGFLKGESANDIDILVRDHELRETVYFLIAKDAKAYEVMGVAAGLEEIPGNYILKLVENFRYNPKTVNVNLAEYLRHFYDMGRQPVLGIIERKEKKQINKLEKFSKDSEYELSVIGAAVFNKQRLIGYLDGIETKAYNIIMGNIKTGIVTFPTPIATIDGISTPTVAMESDIGHQSSSKIRMSTIDIIKLKSKRDVEIVDGNILLKVDIRLRGSLEEFVGNMDISNERNMKEIEKACSQEIKNKLEDTLLKVQKEFETDIFGFGSVFHRKHPEEWHEIKDNWNEIFSKSDIKVEAKTNVIRTGLINVPIGRIKGK